MFPISAPERGEDMRLPETQRQQFFRLHTGLLAFVNREARVIGGADDPEDVRKVPPGDLFPLREALWEDPQWVDRYVSANPDGLSSDELETVSRWRHRRHGSFCILKQLRKHAVFIDLDSTDPRAFGVLALTDPFEDFFASFPVMVDKVVLLPFEGGIVSDGLLASMNLIFGRGIRASLRDWYNEAKARYGIITALPFAAEKKADCDRERLAYYLRSERNREHYAEEIADLTGKSEALKIFYYQEIGKAHARRVGKRLREAGLESGFFAIHDDLILASGSTREELDRNLARILPENRRPYVYIYQLRRNKRSR